MTNQTPIDPMKHLFDWTSVRWNKCLKLYELARVATGPIVELGAYTGNGTIALGLGSRDGNKVPVYGIDKWERFTGLYQQQFYPEDYDEFVKNVKTMNLEDIVIPFKGDTRQVASVWGDTVNLLVWDVSLPTLFSDFLAWRYTIEPDGLFVAKDTTVFDFGWLKVAETAQMEGWTVAFENMDACLFGIRK